MAPAQPDPLPGKGCGKNFGPCRVGCVPDWAGVGWGAAGGGWLVMLRAVRRAWDRRRSASRDARSLCAARGLIFAVLLILVYLAGTLVKGRVW